MSDSPTTPSGKSKDELLNATKEHFGEKRAKQNEALEAIANDGDLEKYETVELGDLELEVKAWTPGSVEETIERAQNIAERGDDVEISRSIETMLTALDEMTPNDTYDRSFWKQFHEKWGQAGMVMAVETVMQPAMDEMEDLQDGVKSFRKTESGQVVGSRNRDNW